jgi:hypothetical protein
MRRASWLAGGGWLVLASLALGQGGSTHSEPVTVTIGAQPVPMRAGPSDAYAITGTLAPGQRVRVLGEQDGRLRIAPPQGSFSWIQDRFLQFHDEKPGVRRTAHVLADNVPVHVGSEQQAGPLPVLQVRLPRGSQVVLLGDSIKHDGDLWWKIEPPVQEVRYIPREAIALAPLAQQASGQSSQPPPIPKNFDPYHVWRVAQEAERTGNVAQAIASYTELAQAYDRPGGDAAFASRCYERIRQLRQLAGATPAVGVQPAGAEKGLTPATLTSTSGQGQGQGPGQGQSGVVSPGAGSARGSGPGWLRRCGFLIDGQKAYALEQTPGNSRVYVTPAPGVNLEPYLNRLVELFGPMQIRPDLPGGAYMVAQRVQPATR